MPEIVIFDLNKDKYIYIYIYIYIYNVLYIMMPVTFQDTQDMEKEHNHLNLSD